MNVNLFFYEQHSCSFYRLEEPVRVLDGDKQVTLINEAEDQLEIDRIGLAKDDHRVRVTCALKP